MLREHYTFWNKWTLEGGGMNRLTEKQKEILDSREQHKYKKYYGQQMDLGAGFTRASLLSLPLGVILENCLAYLRLSSFICKMGVVVGKIIWCIE